VALASSIIFLNSPERMTRTPQTRTRSASFLSEVTTIRFFLLRSASAIRRCAYRVGTWPARKRPSRREKLDPSGKPGQPRVKDRCQPQLLCLCQRRQSLQESGGAHRGLSWSFPDGSSFRGVKVFYARPGSDADTRIVEMAEAERNKKNLIVVTSDRKLADRVRVCVCGSCVRESSGK